MKKRVVFGVGAVMAVAAFAALLSTTQDGGDVAPVKPPEESAAPAAETPHESLQPAEPVDLAPAAPETTDGPVNPSFDIVRISPDGGGVIAGRAEPGAEVELLADGEVVARAEASETGEFAIVTTKPLEEGSRTLTLAATNADGVVTRSADPVIIMAPAIPQSAPIVLRSDRVAPELIQRPEAPKEIDVTLDSITYGDVGSVSLSGRGRVGALVRVYLNVAFVGEAVVGEDGVWTLQLGDDVAPGDYTLRVDEVNAEGKVVSRIESPFQRAPADAIVLAAGQVVVQPGNSLWRIASRVYGEGTLYTEIYQANAGQIRDPDLIYPGQIFDLPEPTR